MQGLVAFVILLASALAYQVNDNYVINKINGLNPGWKAGYNSRFANMTLMDASKLLGLQQDPIPESPVSRIEDKLVSSVYLPREFDARRKWPNCALPIRSQEMCGGCYAFASTSVFSYRQCIQTNGSLKVELSPQYQISCDSGAGACVGATLASSWKFYLANGVMSEADYPYTAQNGYAQPCQAKANVKRYYPSSFKYLSSVLEMQQEIYNNGPIQVGLDVYQDFYNYAEGIYRHVTGSKVGGHTVYLVGWGTDDSGVNYWIAVNSWSEYWGMNGEFYILRGNNECNIEVGFVPIAATITIDPSYTATPIITTTTTTTTTAPTTTTTTKTPTTTTTTTTPTRNCWTCPAGFVHWYDIPGNTEPSDKCACIPAPDYNCWTCPAGLVHWYEVPGMSQPSDRCACVYPPTTTTTTTTRPSTTTTTTRAPTTTTITPIATTTTRVPSTTAPTTSQPTRNCWTCPAGYVHWYDIPGNAEPIDKCACIPAPNYNCWTCPSGYIHWYEMPGMSQPSDRCACVPRLRSRYLVNVHNRMTNNHK